jgi:hypothetical protein
MLMGTAYIVPTLRAWMYFNGMHTASFPSLFYINKAVIGNNSLQKENSSITDVFSLSIVLHKKMK